MTKITEKDPICILLEQLADKKVETKEEFFKVQRSVARHFGIPFFKKDKLIEAYHQAVKLNIITANKTLEKVLRLKKTRSLSGIVVVSVLTKPFACPGKCLYCPTQPGAPKSYLKNEPAVMRAITHKYHPFQQTYARLQALKDTGHPIDKVNIRIIGGTWSAYPKRYQTWFIKEVFRACNDFGLGRKYQPASRGSNNLATQQFKNESAKCRVIEISIETRQDHITKDEIKRLRKFGVTKVELGVQSIYDDILVKNRRGSKNDQTVLATKMLRDTGFKVSYQVMLNLVGSDAVRDSMMFDDLFHNSSYKPDYLKIYPLALVREAPLFGLYLQKGFVPYTKEQLLPLLIKIKQKIPHYCRVERIIRDIPADSIVEGGAKVSNLRQIVLGEMKKSSKNCHCIRCRELREDFDQKEKPVLFRQDYDASEGKEIFLSLESKDRKILYSLLRLRLPSQHFSLEKNFLRVLNSSAIIREIHTYGYQLPIGENDDSAAQHQGFGKKLIKEAERIAKEKFGTSKMAVISGIGVRQYFRKLGYKLENTYMVKKI